MLEEGCRGKDVVNEINDMQNNSLHYHRKTDNKLLDLEADGFSIGEMRDSCKCDLGDKYLLCNGDCIHEWDGYDKLVGLMHNNGYDWYEAVDSSCKYIIDGKTIYQIGITASSNFFGVRVFEDYKALLENRCSEEIQIEPPNPQLHLRNAVKTREKLYVLVQGYTGKPWDYKLWCADMADLHTWKNIWNLPNTTGSNVAINANDHTVGIVYQSKADEICFNYIDSEGTIRANRVASLDYSYTVNSCIVSYVNNLWVIQYAYPINSAGTGALNFAYKSELEDDWNHSVPINISSSYGSYGNIVYYNGYYWFSFCDTNKYYHNIYKGLTPNKEILVKRDENFWGYGMQIRDSKLFSGNRVYDETTQQFVGVSSETLKTYGFTKSGAAITEVDGDEIFIQESCVIPKQGQSQIAALPIKTSDYKYTYIKAKE